MFVSVKFFAFRKKKKTDFVRITWLCFDRATCEEVKSNRRKHSKCYRDAFQSRNSFVHDNDRDHDHDHNYDDT